jgi:hypothetical protein
VRADLVQLQLVCHPQCLGSRLGRFVGLVRGEV